MKISIVTLFPEMFVGPFDYSMLKKAQQKNLLTLHFVNIRDFGIGKQKSVDDKPFGGGTGMVLRVDVLDKAIAHTKDASLTSKEQQCILLDARGKQFTQSTAQTFSSLKHLILICGHYEGVDERARDLVDATVSLGDFIVTGGELPAMIITDAVTRFVPGVLKEDATNLESFSLSHASGKQLLEYPQYTMPRDYKGKQVPEILLSGNHAAITGWKNDQAKLLTQKHRPDLLT